MYVYSFNKLNLYNKILFNESFNIIRIHIKKKN